MAGTVSARKGNPVKTTTIVAFYAATLALAICFATAAQAADVTFDWATIGSPGNAGELSGVSPGGIGIGRGVIVGAVAYTYRISKTEVTNAQYTEFLNAVDPNGNNPLGLFNSAMTDNFGGIELQAGKSAGSKFVAQTGREQNPVTWVSWYDSVRFINWLDNGQPAGGSGTESGAYTLDGNSARPRNELSITRDTGATYWLPSEDEWYKAAYYDPNKPGGAGYYDFATGSDTFPVSDQPSDDRSAANYFNDDEVANGFNDGYAVSGSMSRPKNTGTKNPFTDVGAYTDATSPYGTFDQNGNAWEWNEAWLEGKFRGLRGGGWSSSSNLLAASARIHTTGFPRNSFGSVGFRVASIPEPTSLLLGAMATVVLLMRRRRLR